MLRGNHSKALHFLSRNSAYANGGTFFINVHLPKITHNVRYKTITFHNGLTPKRAEKPKLFLAEESSKCDRRITETLKENLVYEWRAFYRLNQRILLKRTGDIVFSVLSVMLQRQKTFHTFTMDYAGACRTKTSPCRKVK